MPANASTPQRGRSPRPAKRTPNPSDAEDVSPPPKPRTAKKARAAYEEPPAQRPARVDDGSNSSSESEVELVAKPKKQRQQRMVASSAASDACSSAHGGSDDDGRSQGGSTNASSFDDSMGGSTNARSKVSSSGGTSTGCTICGKHFKIPFTVLTFMAMAVPIFMLLITTLIPMGTAVADLVAVESFNGLAAEVSNCVSAMTVEDFRVHDAVYHAAASTRETYTVAREDTDMMCDTRLLTELRAIAQKRPEFDSQRDTMQRAIRALAVQRALLLAGLDKGNYTASREDLEEMRTTFQDIIFRATNVIARVAAVIKSETSRYFVDLNLVGVTRAKLWLAASTGSAYLSVEQPTPLEFIAFAGAAATAESASKSVEAATSPVVAARMAHWHTLPETLAMWELMRGVLYVERGLVAFDKTAFNEVMQRPLDELRAIEADIVDYIAEARESRNAVVQNALLLTFGLLLSALAAGLLARQQIRVQGVLRAQTDRVEKTKRAVAAFVPRFFLNKMGYTSITHVTAGDSREVALTMIFSDIRAFTTVAEGMTNRALFDWVQGFFQLMTTTIEGHHGNINQFIGDALFALFSTANDGIVCAVEMQAKTQQLNLQRLCVEGNTVPLDIGVGIHHDVLSLGILGDERRHTCTALSASVNLASRLEGLTKQLGCRILASESVVDQLAPQILHATAMRKLGVATMKGSAAALTVYDVYQGDERAPQAYKAATLKTFERYTKLALRPDDQITDADHADIAHLRLTLEAAAERYSIKDVSMAAMEAVRDPKSGYLEFDCGV